MSDATLKRSIGLPLLALYGLGTILGAGIYVLVGEVAANAGTAAPSAFVLASLIAAFTALSYAELSSRLPKSAGEAAYVDAAFQRAALSRAVGWAVIISGVVSSATLSRGMVGYLSVFFDLPPSLIIIVMVASLGTLACWGISESLIAAAVITSLEIAGLLFVIVVAGDSFAEFPERWRTLLPAPDAAALSGIVAGAFLAFYAFIGFEDIVNVAEEVKSPRSILPRAIILSLVISTSLYFLVATVAVLSTPIDSLAGSSAPLALVIQNRGFAPESISAISLLAIVNGALIQIIMASRVLYGLADQGLAWQGFARVNPRTRTPLAGTIFVAGVVLLLALCFSLGGLARLTSAVALMIFSMVNAALLRLKARGIAHDGFRAPPAVPITGLALCAGMLLFQMFEFLRNF